MITLKIINKATLFAGALALAVCVGAVDIANAKGKPGGGGGGGKGGGSVDAQSSFSGPDITCDSSADPCYVDGDALIKSSLGDPNGNNPPGFRLDISPPKKNRAGRALIINSSVIDCGSVSGTDNNGDCEVDDVIVDIRPNAQNFPDSDSEGCRDIYTIPSGESRQMGFVLKISGLWIEFASTIDGSSNTQPGRCAEVCFTERGAGDPTGAQDVTVTRNRSVWDVTSDGLATALMCRLSENECLGPTLPMSFGMTFEVK